MAPFPFDAVVITFPDAKAARSASKGPLEELRKAYSTTRILASCDPFQLRVGSGGGTLNALEEVLQNITAPERIPRDNSSLSPSPLSVLILHAGGASSRCPTQMVLGKAWTSLPTQDGIIMTPVWLWFQLAQKLFAKIPAGSVVVIASDTLLDLADETSSSSSSLHWEDMATAMEDHSVNSLHSAVVALSVPASLTVAKNHGVFVVPTNEFRTSRVARCLRVFQKPSLEVLESECAFWHPQHKNGSPQERKAWIDTGVIVFLPEAAEALRSLLSDPTKCRMLKCTKQGIRQAYEDTISNNQQESLPFDKFAAQEAHSIDLYTHILNALQSPTSVEQYCAKFQHELPTHVLKVLFDALSPSRLLIWTVPSGSFLHLGTTKELLQFLTTNPTSVAGTSDANTELRIRMAKSLGLVSTLNAVILERGTNDAVQPSSFSEVKGSALKCDSFFSADTVVIGEGSVVEHCFLNVKQGINIGRNCLLSGLRVDNEEQFYLDDCMMVQQVPLVTGEYVFMVLGLEDDIKADPCSDIYGKPVNDWLTLANLDVDQVWPNTNSRSLWKARIHPICFSGESFGSVFDWMVRLTDGDDYDSTQRWKVRPKLSLAEIRDLAHAPTEFKYRAHLAHFLRNNPGSVSAEIFTNEQLNMIELRRIMMSRHHAPIPIIEMFRSSSFNSKTALLALRTLDEVIVDSFDAKKFDVCGRAWMLMNAALDELASNAPIKGPASVADDQMHDIILSKLDGDIKMMTIQEDLDLFADELCGKKGYDSSLDVCAGVDTFSVIRDALMKNGRADFLAPSLVEMSEKMAQTMIRLCVMGHEPSISRIQPIPSRAILDRWILAVSPARIDLAGGWSDTPPICFEYGSAVTGLAVLVDSLKPLSCRARLSRRDSSILLLSEHRNSLGELVSTEKVKLICVCDLQGFFDPSSQCALLKCALVMLGLVNPEAISRGDNTPLGSVLSKHCGFGDERLCLEVVVTSLLPHGSGLGSSSILAGCLLSSIGKCFGMKFSTNPVEGEHDVLSAVISLEQILGSGGGHQDQVNGLCPGAKITTCAPLEFPLRLEVTPISLDEKFASILDQNLVLVFTGQTRLAKNILQTCLRRFSARHPAIVENVRNLCENALTMKNALQESSLEKLGSLLNLYWEQKKFMAGHDSGVEPETVAKICQALFKEKAIFGASLCGAGGGGFLALVKSADTPLSTLKRTIHDSLAAEDQESISIHSCTIATDGLVTHTLPEFVCSKDDFDLSWLASSVDFT